MAVWGFFFLKGVKRIYLLPLASWKLVVFVIYFCSICFRTFPEGECVCVLSCFSCVQLFVTLWTIAHQTILPMGISRQGSWGGLPCPPPGDLPDPGTGPASLCLPHWQAALYHWKRQPLQRSCLDNPRDGGAWWAAVCGVAQSRTRLNRLSSSTTWEASVEFLKVINKL